MYARTHIYTHTHIPNIGTCLHSYTCKQTSTCIHASTHVYTEAYIHPCMHENCQCIYTSKPHGSTRGSVWLTGISTLTKSKLSRVRFPPLADLAQEIQSPRTGGTTRAPCCASIVTVYAVLTVTTWESMATCQLQQDGALVWLDVPESHTLTTLLFVNVTTYTLGFEVGIARLVLQAFSIH